MKSFQAEYLLNLIKKAKLSYNALLRQFTSQTDDQEKLKLAYKIIALANNASTTYYAAPQIEYFFCQLAQKHSVPLAAAPLKSPSVLHIASEIYETGGHTRVIERWIEHSPDEEKHSLVLTRKNGQKIPPKLEKNIKQKGGEITLLPDSLPDLEKGLQLRQIASLYDRVILHVHMDDAVPLFAFGTPEFKRPVFFFNHADHRFWLGLSISDCVVNFRAWGEQLMQRCRGNKKSFILPLPVSIESLSLTTPQANAKEDSIKTIYSVGSAHKYQPLMQWNFFSAAQKLLKLRSDIKFVLIGPTEQDFPEYNQNDRICFLGPQYPHKMMELLQNADVVWDSFPMSGSTAILDAISLHKPVLSLNCPTGHSDFITNSSVYCETEDELLNKTCTLLDCPQQGQQTSHLLLKNIQENSDSACWRNKLAQLYGGTLCHTLHPMQNIQEKEPDALDVYLCQQSTVVRRAGIKSLFEKITRYEAGEKYTIFKLFGLTVLKMKRCMQP